MSSSTIHILMTGAGAPGAPGIIHCLKQDENISLTVADARADAIGKHLVQDFVQIPAAHEPSFIDRLLEVCMDKKIQVLLPLVTKELLILSKNKKRFKENGTAILVSSEEAIARSNNKSSCYEFLRAKGIDVPDFFTVENINGFIKAAAQLGHPEKPFCFKPSVANGSRGFRTVFEDPDEAALLFNEKPYQTIISYAHAVNILSSKPFPELLLSEYLPGEEYSVDCIADNGRAKLIIPRTRKKMINGISVEGRFEKNEEVISYCRSIIEATGLHGNIGIQVKYSDHQKPLLLEINPRVQGTIVAALGAGVNLPLLAVKQELGAVISEDETTVKWGTSFARYWTEVFY